MFATDLVTWSPCRWTTAGSSGVASCSLFWTCIWATFWSTPALKVSVIVAVPFASLVAAM